MCSVCQSLIFLQFIQLCPINLIKEKLTALIESTFQRGNSPNLDCNDDKKTFFISDDQICLKVCSC